MTIAALLLLSFQPALAEPVCERVDVLELNRFHDESARLVFTQWILWSGGNVIAWRMADKVNAMPRRTGRDWVLLWSDCGVMREVRAVSFRESWTQSGVDGDPELNDREILPACERRELRKP